MGLESGQPSRLLQRESEVVQLVHQVVHRLLQLHQLPAHPMAARNLSSRVAQPPIQGDRCGLLRAKDRNALVSAAGARPARDLGAAQPRVHPALRVADHALDLLHLRRGADVAGRLRTERALYHLDRVRHRRGLRSGEGGGQGQGGAPEGVPAAPNHVSEEGVGQMEGRT